MASSDLEEKSKGILNIGSHCHLCNNIDFLPFTCDECGFNFCQTHRVPESHGCKRKEVVRSTPSPRPSKSSGQRLDSVPKGPKPGPSSTTKPVAAKPASSPAKASQLDKLKAFWANKKSTSKPSSKVSPFLALSKLKKEAVGDPSSTPEPKRLYLYISRPAYTYTDAITNQEAVHPEKKKAVFFDKTITVGKLLDKACIHLDVTNKNNSDASNRLVLSHNGSLLSFSSKVGEALSNGDTVEIRKQKELSP
ncbi:CDC48-associated ubiquitin-like/zinc finger protein 1 [Trichomonascus vanleenenianus]|uniref:Cuz1p n=1 Tax=Trichomonascus vanleenenianus TaxID=2268995 RepID=UPI003ECACA70